MAISPWIDSPDNIIIIEFDKTHIQVDHQIIGVLKNLIYWIQSIAVFIEIGYQIKTKKLPNNRIIELKI